MPTLSILLLLITSTILICIVPGPDMLYIISRSAAQGRTAGVISCLGIATGGVLQSIAVALGLSSLFLAVPIAYDIIKYAGAIYLIYLGIRFLLNREELISTNANKQQVNLHQAFFQGALTTLLNPKVALFYVAFLPQFVNPDLGPISLQLLFLGLTFNITGLCVDTSIALLASLLGMLLKNYVKAAKALQWLTGSVLIALGIRLAFSKRD